MISNENQYSDKKNEFLLSLEQITSSIDQIIDTLQHKDDDKYEEILDIVTNNSKLYFLKGDVEELKKLYVEIGCISDEETPKLVQEDELIDNDNDRYECST